MKMEHINENTIRVLLGSEDLSARGITVLDLLGNHKQIQDFFYSILDEVDTDHEFRNNEAVTFQVLPTRQGLELFISKADPNDADGNANNAAISKYIKREMTAKDQPTLNQRMTNLGQPVDDSQGAAVENAVSNQPQVTRVAKFATFEDLVSACQAVEVPDELASDLYAMDGQYFLVITFFNEGTLTGEMVDDLMAILSEYAEKTTATADLLAEHGRLLMSHAALERIQYYFK